MYEFKSQSFSELNTEKLYKIMKLRVDVFVVEQNCPYPELDGQDDQCQHIYYQQQGQILAYLRIVPPGKRFEYPSLGRIIVHSSCRGQGVSHQLMMEGISECERLYPGQSIVLSAQHHLQGIYAKHGFKPCSEAYDEDGILHIDMLRTYR